ncbi:MAG: TfoX/Sxy family protein [Ruminococcaceae bacterium]|nr:TfoX/Sxy family protein [Oscillospiraceae bacterium]
MGELQKLPNIADKLEVQLQGVGICTPRQLRAVGSREAWLRILAVDPSACINRLYGLEGAVQGIRWHHLDTATKQDLKAFYTAHKNII